MLSRLRSLDARLLKRQCVECGYDGALLRGGMAARCARCGCDLRKRPARSYAEMEGLLGQPYVRDARLAASDDAHTGRVAERLISRWLAFLFGGMLLLIAIAYLSAAVVPG